MTRISWIAAVLFAFTAGVYCFSAPVADNDLWGHVYFGRAILEGGSLPRFNEYSYTAPRHPWINHEILAECIFASTFDRFGAPGLLALKLLVGIATLAVVMKTCRARTSSPLAWAIAVFVCASLMAWGLLIRPQMFTFLGLAVVWNRIHAYERKPSWVQLAPLPVLFALWINTHGGVAAGLGVFLVYATAVFIAPQSSSQRAAIAIIAGLSVAALLLNPYGFKLPAFLLEDLARSRPISEWQPIVLFDASNILFKSTLLILLAGCPWNRRRIHWELLIVAVAAILAFRHQRHMPLFAVLAAPLLTEALDRLGRQFLKRAHLPALSPAAHALLTTGLVGLAAFELGRVHAIYRGLEAQIFVSPELFPVDAVRFIERNGLRGNLLLPFDWGEYAIWHLYPDCRVSIDGRYTTAYPDHLLAQSRQFELGEVGWDAALVDADLALLDRRQPIVEQMFKMQGWQYVYSDQTALVFVRKVIAESRHFVRELRTEPQDAFFFP